MNEWDKTVSLIARSKMKVFRRLYMKRRTQNGYESNWQKIDPKYILSYGSVTHSIDDIKPNFFNISGLTIKVRNNDGYFNDVDDSKSFWNGFLSRYKTLVKIEAGYEDEDGNEYPSNSIQYIGIIGKDFEMDERSELEIQTNNISSIFNDVPATQIKGIGATLTASEIITKIKEHTDNNGVKIFQQYITESAWHIATTTTYYNFATSTSLQGMSCLDLLKKLAEAENYIFYVTRDGSFYWKKRASYYEIQTATYYYTSTTDDSMILWNKLGSNSEVTNSEVGPNGMIIGTVLYYSAKFGNGAYSNNDSNYIIFPMTSFYPNTFTYEYWFKTDYDVINGRSSDGNNHSLMCWFYNTSYQIALEISANYTALHIHDGPNYYQYIITSLSWNRNELHHIAIVIDRNGINGSSDIIRIYLDNVLKYSSTQSFNYIPVKGSFYVLITRYLGIALNFKGVQDNLKVYNYAKTDFSDREIEDTYHQTTTVATTTTYTYEFHGLNVPSSKFGHNIMKRISIKKPISKVYNRVRIKFGKEDTLTSYYIKEENWSWGDSSSSYKYGVSTYDIENEWIPNTATAMAIAESIYNEMKEVKEEITIETKFIPIVELLEKVTLGYKSQVKEGTLWGYFLWGYGVGSPRLGKHIDYEGKEFKIIKMIHDFDTFKSQFVLQEI